jgi:hypothetical protein
LDVFFFATPLASRYSKVERQFNTSIFHRLERENVCRIMQNHKFTVQRNQALAKKSGEFLTGGEQAIAALLEHGTQEKAAAAAGISPVTLWRLQRKPKFQKALLQARSDAR